MRKLHKKIFYFLIILSTLSFSNIYSQADNNLPLLKLWATYYYVPITEHEENGIDLLDSKGNKVGLKLNTCDWCTACIEGTVLVKKNEKTFILNYAGRSNNLQYDCRECEKYKNYNGYEETGKVLWSISDEFGQGVKGYRLVPFKSLAVDSSFIPFGSVLFIPKAKGIRYTDANGNQKIHDGFFFAADTGSKIKGNHIDVFIGIARKNPFDFVKSSSSKTFNSYFVNDLGIKGDLLKMHK